MKNLNLKNLLKNWWFVLSAVAFFFLSVSSEYASESLILAFFASIYIALREKNILKHAFDNKVFFLILSFVSAVSVVIANTQVAFFDRVNLLQTKLAFLPFVNSLDPYMLLKLCKLLSIPFCFVLLSESYKFIGKIFKNLISLVTKKDLICAAFLCFVLLTLSAIAFFKTSVVFGVPYKCNIVYTSDISILFDKYCYTTVSHFQNDIRQPLFAVFSAPFFAPIYLFGKLFPSTIRIYAFLTMAMNIALIATSFLLISTCVTNEQKDKLGILFLLFCMYASLLYSLLIEQYQVALFWLLAYFFYCIKEKDSLITNKVTYIAASGTLTTNATFFPLMFYKKNTKDAAIILRDTLCLGLFTICFSGQLPVVLSMYNNFSELMIYTGRKMSIAMKLLDFVAFIPGCFIAPSAYMKNGSWILSAASPLTAIIGVAIFALCTISFVMNRKNIWAKISFSWIIYSFIIIGIIGWGLSENGSILYSLYFGWAYCVLIHFFINSLFEKIKIKNGAFVTEILLAILMLLYNIPKIMEMLNQLAVHYPA